MSPMQQAKNTVFRMKLEQRSGALTPERATRFLDRLEHLLDDLDPDTAPMSRTGLAALDAFAKGVLADGERRDLRSRLTVIEGDRP